MFVNVYHTNDDSDVTVTGGFENLTGALDDLKSSFKQCLLDCGLHCPVVIPDCLDGGEYTIDAEQPHIQGRLTDEGYAISAGDHQCWANVVLIGKPMQTSMVVPTPLGTIVCKKAVDSEHPGVYIDLKREGCDCDAPLALVEYSGAGEEADLPDNREDIITRVWGDVSEEDYSERVVHDGIEKYFAAPKDN